MKFLAASLGPVNPWPEAPKGRNSIAQGNALGIRLKMTFALKGRHQRRVPPFQGSDFPTDISQGVALGFHVFAPSGLPATDGCSPKTTRNQK